MVTGARAAVAVIDGVPAVRTGCIDADRPNLASINDTPVPAIIDTGATRSIINAEWAQRLALSASGTASASALTRPVSGTRYRVAALGVSGIVLHNIDISSYDMSAIEGAFSREVPFVIGQDFLSTIVLEVDFLHDRVRLSPAVKPDLTKGFTKLPVALGKTDLPNLQIGIENRLQSEAIIDLGSNVVCSISENLRESIVCSTIGRPLLQ